ncbi:LacI family DNA-binding transcriptional regulator [Actinotalea subterranea]|uniref:LacI family DNA-binding transcriptional regulator n=1 Tax=Actinotalea subterranea TaxID=2607497 RepID=UPI0011EE6A53|nr:LacI family DNA-binding transcriptional regulator [Actinotalea subterranea]
MSRDARRVTITDVAARAGVSVATVSYVLNDKPGAKITPATRDRVRAAASALGYRPNALAQGLLHGTSRFIGVVADAIATTPFAGQLLEGAQAEAWRHGYLLLIANTGDDLQVEQNTLRVMLEHRVAGVLYSTYFHRQVIAPRELAEVPHVLANCYSADPRQTAVVPDEVGGGRSATQLLLDAGHRRIGFINSVEDAPGPSGRLAGYTAAIKDAGLPPDPALVFAAGHDQESGYVGVQVLLDDPQPPTALFCYNDRVAMGAYDALRERGLRVPEDIAVVGFDNQEVIAGHLRPTLTTVALPHYEIGVRAVQALLGVADGGPRHVIECPVVLRESVGTRVD